MNLLLIKGSIQEVINIYIKRILSILKKVLKEMNEMRKMMGLSRISEQENPGAGKSFGRTAGGGTGAANAGQYISSGAFDPGGILTKNGRKKDSGKLPEVVDITGGETGTFQTVDVHIPQDNITTRAAEQQKKDDDKNFNKIKKLPTPSYELIPTPQSDDDDRPDRPRPEKPDGGGDNPDRPTKDRNPKPKGHNKTIRRAGCCKKCKNGKFSNFCDDKGKERGCVHPTISDCQLAKR